MEKLELPFRRVVFDNKWLSGNQVGIDNAGLPGFAGPIDDANDTGDLFQVGKTCFVLVRCGGSQPRGPNDSSLVLSGSTFVPVAGLVRHR